MDALANPVWTALTTMQAKFAEGRGRARRFHPEVTKLAAVQDETEASFQDLAELLLDGQAAGIRLPSHEMPIFAGLEKVAEFSVALMVQKKPASTKPPSTPSVPLE